VSIVRAVRPVLRLSLRTKLALVALVLAFVLPWLGFRYVREMERFLLDAQERSLLASARAVATVLHERPQLLRMPASSAAHKPEPASPDPIATMAEAIQGNGPSTGGASSEAARTRPVELGRESHTAQNPEQEVLAILRGLERSAARIWVLSRQLEIIALAGTLQPAPDAAASPTSVWSRAWRELVGELLPEPSAQFDDAIDPDVLANGQEIDSAFRGVERTRVRNSKDGRAVIISAAHPIWYRDAIIGAVVAEESTHAVERVRNRALERLLLLTLTAVAGTVVLLLWFASRISSRVRRLRNEVDQAIDARGRVKGIVAGSSAGDEIGDLSRSFSTMLRKLAEHHGYLEGLASRLSHELRTPAAVVRSSLENLKLAAPGELAGKYIERAEDGVHRLSKILTRMSEASRLEQSLQGAQRELLDLNAFVAECLRGYRSAYPSRTFELAAPAHPLHVLAAADLLVQLLDKLVSNAADFAFAGTPIRLKMGAEGQYAFVSVSNDGPLLPESIRERLFESMVSLRSVRADDEPHLGLGLYVARLITEFHGGSIEASNLDSGQGVMFRVRLPRADTGESRSGRYPGPS
jgi:dedicated sortase system histidine kinase